MEERDRRKKEKVRDRRVEEVRGCQRGIWKEKRRIIGVEVEVKEKVHLNRSRKGRGRKKEK